MASRRPKTGILYLVPFFLLAGVLELGTLAGVEEFFWPYPTPMLNAFEDALADFNRPKEITWIDPDQLDLPPPRVNLPSIEPKLRKLKKKKSSKALKRLSQTQPLPKKVKPKAKEKVVAKKAPAKTKINKKSVIVDDDENVVKEIPEEAQFLSDKNRRVKKQSRAKETNLEKAQKGEVVASAKNPDQSSKEIGGKEEKIRQLEKSKASELESKRKQESVHSGKKKQALGLKGGDGGKSGNGGSGLSGGALSMRDLGGKMAPGQKGRGGGRVGDGKPGKKGRPGPKLALDFKDYQRVVGNEKYKEEKSLAMRGKSHRKGRWAKRLGRAKSALENFVPEVQPGNQSALNTRAHPFAVFIARMHLRIHELWGFGYLEDLGRTPDSSPLNDWTLATKLEIVLNPEGEIHKVSVIGTSGVLPFDVAAVDVVYSAGPYARPPRDILSANGMVYLHWTFHRDNRQCATYFAEPYILNNPNVNTDKGNENSILNPKRKLNRLGRGKGSPKEGGYQVGRVDKAAPDGAATRRTDMARANPRDPLAQTFARQAASAIENNDAVLLIRMSQLPFVANGQVTDSSGVLRRIWAGTLNEIAGGKVKEFKLVSPAGYRALFGSLPQGALEGSATLFLVVRVGAETLSVFVRNEDTGYRIVGLSR